MSVSRGLAVLRLARAVPRPASLTRLSHKSGALACFRKRIEAYITFSYRLDPTWSASFKSHHDHVLLVEASIHAGELRSLCVCMYVIHV